MFSIMLQDTTPLTTRDDVEGSSIVSIQSEPVKWKPGKFMLYIVQAEDASYVFVVMFL